MPTYPSETLNKICRKETVPYIYGQAIVDVPPEDGTYLFRILRMVKIEDDSQENSSYAVSYRLEPTLQTTTATNTTFVKVRQGNKVILVKTRLGYDIFCDCSSHQIGLVIEPSLPMLIPNAPPNFAGTDKTGKPYSIEDAYRSIGFRNALCVGTIAVEGTRYYPLKATYRGGEQYYDTNGNSQYRMPGEEIQTAEGNAVYLMRRELEKTSGHYLDHKDNSNQQSVSSGIVPEILGYLDSPYKYRYVDGNPCPIGLPPNITATISLANWATTTDPTKAQYDYDLFLCPKQAEGEPIPPNTLVPIVKQVATSYKYPMRNKQGKEIDPVDGIVNTAHTVYYEVLPPTDRYFTSLIGQASTKGFNYETPFNPLIGDYPYSFSDTPQDDLIMVKNCTSSTSDGNNRPSPRKKVYANALLNLDGSVKLNTKHKVINSKNTAPSRGAFRIATDRYFFNVLFSLSTERGFGVPCQIDQIKFGGGTNETVKTTTYYEVVRKLVDPSIGKYVLQLIPTEPYMSDAEIESLPFE